MKGKFDAYVLWPLDKRVQNWIVAQSTARNFMVVTMTFLHLYSCIIIPKVNTATSLLLDIHDKPTNVWLLHTTVLEIKVLALNIDTDWRHTWSSHLNRLKVSAKTWPDTSQCSCMFRLKPHDMYWLNLL